MKKKDLAKLAIIGISVGMIVAGCQRRTTADQRNAPTSNAEQMSSDVKDFYNSLSDDGKEKFNELDAQHKMMAVEMAQQSCEGKNLCAGMGGCETNGHDCAGKNDCKGLGGTPVDDAEKAVEVQHENQMEERETMSQNIEAATAPVAEIVQAEQPTPETPAATEAVN